MAPINSSVKEVLKDEFSIYPGKFTPCDVYLYQNCLEYCRKTGQNSNLNKKVSIEFVDVVGGHCFEDRDFILNKKRPKNEDISSAFFCLYHYPRCNDIRQKQVVAFRVNKHETFEENLTIAKKWRTAILHILRGATLRGEEDVENLSVPRPRKMLVFVNPYSGTRRAEPIFHKKVAPLFHEADIKYELVITKHQFHAKKMVEELEDLNSYNGIVIISGDGLVYEVLNGLMARKDRQEALKIPIGVVPGGSGNALAACVLSAEQDSYRKNAVLHSAFTIAKGGKQPMDLVKVQTPSVSTYSFLCISWAMISDIDIESERFRSLGPVRFLLGAIVRTICLRRYQGRLSYLPVEDTSRYEEHFSKPLQKVENDLSRQTNLLSSCSKSLPVLDSEPRLVNIRPIGTSPSFPSSLPNQCSNSNSLHNLAQVDNVEMNNDSDSTNSVENLKDTTNNSSTNNSDKTLLRPLDQPVPSNWVTIEGEFIGFCAVYTSHISQDAYMWPGRKSDEGVISIQYIMSPLSRASIASLLLAFDDASHTQSDILRTVFAQAFRLESLEPDRGILTIDGEALEKGTSCIQAEVIQRKFQIIRPGNGTSSS